MSAITHLQLKNFTAFTELAIDFSPDINIVIGESGTGKMLLLEPTADLDHHRAQT